jgi:hypothetical protein
MTAQDSLHFGLSLFWSELRLTSFSKSKSKLFYDWWLTANQFVLASSPLRLMTRYFFHLNLWDNSPYIISSLTRRRISFLWICLAFRQAYISRMSIAYSMLLKILPLHYTQVPCQYRLRRADHAYLTYFMLQRQPSYLNGSKLYHRQV